MKNHYLISVLSIILSILLCGTKAYAYDFQAANGDGVTIYYDIVGSNVTVTSGSQKYEGVVKIPSSVQYNGKSYNVTSIGEKAFYFCGNLTAIEIPSTVTSIGENGFYSCGKLATLTIPGSVKSIGAYAFDDCGISTLELSEGIIMIGNYAFNSCDKLISVTIPSTVKSIGMKAFGNTRSLLSISVAADNTVYDSRSKCNAIIETASNTLVAGCQTTIIPESVTAIGEGAFYFCGNLKYIEIPSTVTSIGGSAFYSCSKLAALTIPGSVKSIGAYAFDDCGISTLELSEGIIMIGNYAFNSCNKLISVTIPSTVKSIGTKAFGNTDGLLSISVAEGNTIYDSRCECNAIIETASNTLVAGCQTTIIPEGVTAIGEGAFYFCGNLKYIEIPSTVTSIGGSAFYSCSKLIEVVSLIQNPFKINDNVFSSIPSYAVLYVPAGTKETYERVGGWKSNFSTIIEMSDPNPETEIIEFPDSPLRTFCSSNALDFSTVDGIEVYIASGFNAATGNVIMTKVERVPAHTGVLLLDKMGQTYEIPIDQFECDYSNLLVGVVTDTSISQGYMLGDDGCFSPINGTQTIKAKEAYLNLPQNNASQVKICFEDGIATDIDTIEKTTDSPSDTWFTLQGNRLNKKPIKQGIYLHGGRKVFVK